MREEGSLASLLGRFHIARSRFEKSFAKSEKFGMAFESTWTLYERGRFATVAGWNDWIHDQAEGLERLRRLGGWIPGVELEPPRPQRHLASLDRFARVLEGGRRLVALEAEEEVLEVLLSEARALLRCDQVAFVVEGQPTPSGWSTTLHQSCLQAQRAVTEAVVQEPSRSMLLHDARSTLMAPLKVEGHHLGVLVAWQKTIGGFFGEEETRLADYLCTLAGASLENARILAQRKQTFQALQTSEQRFRGFFEHAGVGTALLDEHGKAIQENPYLAHLLGGSSETGAPWEYCHAEERKALAQLCCNVDRSLHISVATMAGGDLTSR